MLTTVYRVSTGWITRRRAPVVLAAAVFALVVAAAILRAPEGPGPLAQAAETEDTAPIDIGQDLSFGQIVLNNPTAEIATIRSITPLDRSPGLEILAIRVVRRGDPPLSLTGTGLGYPPAGIPVARMAEPAGFAVRPVIGERLWQEQVEVLVGLRATAAGRFGISGFRVDYTLGGRTYSDVFKQAIWLCAPASTTNDQGCNP